MVDYKPVIGFSGHRIGSDGSVWKKKRCIGKLRTRRANPKAKIYYDNFSWVLLNVTKEGCVNLDSGKRSRSLVKRKVSDLMQQYFPK